MTAEHQLLVQLLAAHAQRPTSPCLSIMSVSDDQLPVLRQLVAQQLAVHDGSLVWLTPAGRSAAKQVTDG